MIRDHILFLKSLVEDNIKSRDGLATPLKEKFYEVYPKSSTILKSAPCAALSHRSGRTKKNGSLDGSVTGATEITRTKKLYDSEPLYQVDLYSRDIYDFIEKDETYTGFLKQLVQLIANNDSFIAADGRSIGIECGMNGIISDHSLIVDGVCKAFCQVRFIDGIYQDTAVPKITGVSIGEGGILDG